MKISIHWIWGVLICCYTFHCILIQQRDVFAMHFLLANTIFWYWHCISDFDFSQTNMVDWSIFWFYLYLHCMPVFSLLNWKIFQLTLNQSSFFYFLHQFWMNSGYTHVDKLWIFILTNFHFIAWKGSLFSTFTPMRLTLQVITLSHFSFLCNVIHRETIALYAKSVGLLVLGGMRWFDIKHKFHCIKHFDRKNMFCVVHQVDIGVMWYVFTTPS